jgi:uncharacterized membrane protein
MKYLYLIKFLIYGGIASYDYSIGSKFTLAWAMLAILTLSFLIVEEVKEVIEKQAKPNP